jgi:hypothetical protein
MSGWFELEVGWERQADLRREAERRRALAEAVRGERQTERLDGRPQAPGGSLLLFSRMTARRKERPLPL